MAENLQKTAELAEIIGESPSLKTCLRRRGKQREQETLS